MLGWAGSAVAGPASVPPSPASTAPRPASDAAPEARLAALELLARAQPAAALAQLAAWLPAVPAASPQRVLALALRGTLQAQLDDAEAADLTLRELDGLQSRAAGAAAAAGLVRAELAAKNGPARRAERLATDALALLPGDALPALRIRLLRVLARVKEDTGQLDEGVRLRQQIIALADRHGPGWRRAEARSSLASSLHSAKQPEQARALNQEALAMARAEQDLITESRALTTESFLLADAGDTPGMLRAMTQVIELTRRAGARHEEVLALANIADYYLRAGDYATALRLSQQALPLSRELADPTSESVALANIGLSLISLRRRDEGLDYMRQAMAIDERTGALTGLAEFQEEMARYLERAGYLKDAVEAFRKHRKLSDDVFRRDQQQAILELQEGFDNERRQRELALLQLENHLKQAQLLTSELQQRVWLAGITIGLLMLVVAALLLHRLRRTGRALSEGNALLQTQSERDPLTHLANRRYLQRVMQPDSAGADRVFEGSLLLIDLDHFKRINDRHGHAAGDAVLVEVARRLRATLRDEDLIVRWGGEEFLVVARELTQDQLQALAQRLLTAVGSAPVELPGMAEGGVAVSASIGYASFPTEPTRLAVHWEHALDLVDTALYLAKAHGRNLAYGVRLLHARDASELVQISRGLEAAWSEGRVKLTPLRGPALAPTPTLSPTAAGAAVAAHGHEALR
ncbi:diguanylate cyclase [Aquabacterium sp.]|uniref:diguanylate cyclase n=1 Tax=Aquabacterium sp. TaxID=1872578 RepID=UPI002B695AFC|nr:diguanylate cyclase [Aquabacterium sp.]HSW05356.1 diguanylate cyclase [Aquabacterium sp.]